mmetsp:Transcript_11225/g.43746  ORF Transcript_11225/g.43746 Transcript_11225/m.43746 type:complete len:357 (+) Transcript_11225:2235-3305(+)
MGLLGYPLSLGAYPGLLLFLPDPLSLLLLDPEELSLLRGGLLRGSLGGGGGQTGGIRPSGEDGGPTRGHPLHPRRRGRPRLLVRGGHAGVIARVRDGRDATLAPTHHAGVAVPPRTRGGAAVLPDLLLLRPDSLPAVGVVVAVGRRGGSGLLRGRVLRLDAEDEHSDERRRLRGVEIEAELLVGRVVDERPQRADPVPARRRRHGTLHPGGLAPDLRGERGPGIPVALPRVVFDVHLALRGRLENALELLLRQVVEEQGHARLDVLHERPRLLGQAKQAIPHALVVGVSAADEDDTAEFVAAARGHAHVFARRAPVELVEDLGRRLVPRHLYSRQHTQPPTRWFSFSDAVQQARSL